MVIKGKTRAEIAKNLGISKQAFLQRIKRNCTGRLYIDDTRLFCYETDDEPVGKGRKPACSNYDASYTGNYISRKEYAEKYKISIAMVSYLVKNNKLKTDAFGKLVADEKI